MKTNTFFNKYILFVVLMLAAGQAMQAQDAFYIYRNDGDFDGFFFDEVKRIGYSKFDLDSVEHDVYVVQEIELEDSIYRIPLSAIDSVGFQQPEIRLKPKVKLVRDGLLPYIVSASNTKVILSEDVPDALVPYPNTILVGLATDENAETLYEGGSFACVVKQVYKQGMTNGRTIYGEQVEDLAQIFDQLITVEEVGVDSGGNARLRVAGFNADGTPKTGPRKSTSNYNFSILDWSGHLTLKQGDITTPSNDDPFAIAYNVGIDVGLKVNTRVVFSYTGIVNKHLYVKIVNTEEMSAAVTGEIKSEKVFYDDMDCLAALPGFKFPSFLPFFEIRPLPKAFIEVGGSVGLKLKLPSFKLNMAQTLIIDDEDPWLVSMKWGDRDKDPEGGEAVGKDASWISGAELKFNGWIYGGFMLPVTIETNKWLESIFHASIGTTIKAGPKLEGTLIFTTEGQGATMSSSGIDFSLVDVSQDTGVAGSVGGKTAITRSIWNTETKFFTTHFGGAPNVTNIELKDKWTVLETATDSETGETFTVWSGMSSVQPVLHLEGNVFRDVRLGVQLMKTKRPVETIASWEEEAVEWESASAIQWLDGTYSFGTQHSTLSASSPLTISEWGPHSGFPEKSTRYAIKVYGMYPNGGQMFEITSQTINSVVCAGDAQ